MPKYNSIDTIPAKVYFQIKESKDFQLLKPKPKEQGLEQVFTAIDDEFFKRSDNPQAKRYLQLLVEINALNYKIATLKQLLHFYYYSPYQSVLDMEGLKNTLSEQYNIDLDLNEPFGQEVLRILNIEVGILKNDLTFLNEEYNDIVKGSSAAQFSYHKSLASMSMALPNNSLLKEEMSLAVYSELLNMAKKVNEKN